jgi:RNA polymerase sigma-70 factor (ECF subfamily)
VKAASTTFCLGKEQLARLYDAIAQLNDVEKAMVTLFLEDFSYEEMAGVLGLSAGNVGVMLGLTT